MLHCHLEETQERHVVDGRALCGELLKCIENPPRKHNPRGGVCGEIEKMGKSTQANLNAWQPEVEAASGHQRRPAKVDNHGTSMWTYMWTLFILDVMISQSGTNQSRCYFSQQLCSRNDFRSSILQLSLSL
jgi:hypothetical protein